MNHPGVIRLYEVIQNPIYIGLVI